VLFFSLLLSSTYPDADGRDFIVGKGGNVGGPYSMKPAMDLLQAQGWKPEESSVAIVGDTLNTDIKAGKLAGIFSIFVLSGIHDTSDLPYYPDKPNCILSNVGEIQKYGNPASKW